MLEKPPTRKNRPLTPERGAGRIARNRMRIAWMYYVEGLTQNLLKCAITNAVRALPVGIIRGVDQQFTGKVDRIDKDFLGELIDRQIIPVLPPIGFGPDGKSLRLNSDLLAAEVAEALQATKILFLGPVAGLGIDGLEWYAGFREMADESAWEGFRRPMVWFSWMPASCPVRGTRLDRWPRSRGSSTRSPSRAASWKKPVM